ncbi:MAG: hypothetical protein ACRC1T_05430 [Clostridium chrysemydis]|uniref:hypothetical protein n=1 Tax=Clostridium chrysemydis TaxID=2665504 RepID=UPI003F401ADD
MVRELNGAFQNEIHITEQIIIQFVDNIQDIMNELAKVQDNFEIKVKAEELYQKIKSDLLKGDAKING